MTNSPAFIFIIKNKNHIYELSILDIRIQEFEVQITQLVQENQKLTTKNEDIKFEKNIMCQEVQNLSHRVTVLMNLINSKEV